MTDPAASLSLDQVKANLGNFSAGNGGSLSTTPTTPAPQLTTPAPISYQPTTTFNSTPTAPQTTQTPTPTQPTQIAQPTAQQTTQPTAQAAAPTTSAPTNSAAPLAMPMNGSVVDLLNSAGMDSSFASRQALASQFGIQGYTGTASQNQQLAQKYTDAFNAKKGSPVPQNGADARSSLDTHLQENQTPVDPEKAFYDAIGSMNPVVKSMYDTINQSLSVMNTQQSFTQQYQDLVAQQGIPALQTNLMNINNVINGSEDDIRNEITKAGGLATDSQVQALTASRNKVLLTQASTLQQQLQQKEDYVNQIMQFSQADKTELGKQIDTQLNLADKMNTIQTQSDKAAVDNYNNIVKTIGFTGLATSVAGNPQLQAQIEHSLGLGQGSLSHGSAFLASQPRTGEKLQFVSGTTSQSSGYFDPNTGKFTSYGKSGGSGSGSGTTNGSAYSGIVSTILASGKFTKDQSSQIANAINNGEDPLTVIKNNAKNIMGQTLATQLTNNEIAKDQIGKVQSDLNQYYAAGGKTDVFSGTYQETINKLGNITDPKLVSVATEMKVAMQKYRLAVTGTAASVQEDQKIQSMFPGIGKTQGLNQAIVEGLQTSFQTEIDSAYRSALGSSYDKLQNLAQGPSIQVVDASGAIGTIPASQVQEALTQGYSLLPAGQSKIPK